MHYASSPCTLPILHLVRRTVRRSRAAIALFLLLLLALLFFTLPAPSSLLLLSTPRLPNLTHPISPLPPPPPRTPSSRAVLLPAARPPPPPHPGQNNSNNSSRVASDRGAAFWVTVIPRGRLGNQMFQYASLLGIAEINGMEPFVSSVCKVTHYFANVRVSDRPVSDWDTLEEANYGEKDDSLDTLPREHVRLKGFFQSWKYFAAVSQKVRQAFVFLPDVQQAVEQFFLNHTETLRKEEEEGEGEEEEGEEGGKNSVVKIGVHVRRTDMLHRITQKQGYVPAPLSYLRKAMRHMRSTFANRTVLFFVVSDDPDWCREHLEESGVRVVGSAPSVVHLGFLALCQNVIMTVGTFGWWAAYLAGGHVVYYSGFPRAGSEISEGFNPRDYYLPHWVAIGD